MDGSYLTHDQEGQLLQYLARAEQLLVRTHADQVTRVVQPAKQVVAALAHDGQSPQCFGPGLHDFIRLPSFGRCKPMT